MKIEKTEVWITCEKALEESDGTAVRGFFGNLYRNRPEFHGHKGNELIYKHPLIQYKVFGGSALIVGIKEGAYLLKAVPKLDHLEIQHKKYVILKQNTNNEIIVFGLAEEPIRYSFVTPWVALNEENYEKYLRLQKQSEDANALIERILVGNILSMSKAFSYVVRGQLKAKVRLKKVEIINIKNKLELMAFNGEFEINFFIPDFWGIGKLSSRGYGTVKCKNGDEK